MIQRTLPLRCIATDEPEMLSNTFQMFEAGLFVLRIVSKRYRQQPQLRPDHFNDRGRNGTRVGKKIAGPPQRTELYSESQSVGWSSTLVHLFHVRPGQREVLAECVVIDLVRQVLRLFQPVIRAGTATRSRGGVQGFAPLMARR